MPVILIELLSNVYYIDFQSLHKMSYGWLAQSSFLPKKSKPIKVEDEGSLFGLKTILMKQKEKIIKGIDPKARINVKEKQSRNHGITQRIKKDEIAHISSSKLHETQKVLKKKEEIYNQLEQSKRNVGKLLVDFRQKSLLNDQDEDYQKKKELFYSGKLQEVQQQREQVQGYNLGEQDARERLTWQKQVLAELKGQFQEKEKVKQVFDRKLDKQEKQALQKIRKELTAQQSLIQESKKRREQIRAQRIYKLSKLNILGRGEQKSELKFSQQQGQGQKKEIK